MTRQEALHELYTIFGYGFYNKRVDEALNMAIKALEQEPCEDAVSRKALLDKAYAYGNGLEPEGYCVNVEDVQALPSVAPTRKTGKWIAIDDTHSQCMECGAIFCITSSNEWEVNYCPNCGKRMESEEQ